MRDAAWPRENLSVLDSISIVIGVVVGVGIFKTPSLVASVSDSGAMLVLFWLLGGVLSCIGALCFAELASTYPHPGGDYHFLGRAFGPMCAFLFAWSRMAIIQSGSIAMVCFLIGDYATELFRLGPASHILYALATVISLTAVNMLGISQGKRTQHVFVALILFGILAAIAASVFIPRSFSPLAGGNIIPSRAALGTAMIFVLLTYGGWNEASFISAEMIARKKTMVTALLVSIAVITALYVLVNIALLRGLGLAAMAASAAPVADLLETAVGAPGAKAITGLILIAALSTVNAMIITGARTNYALGKDHSLLRFMGTWGKKRDTPRNALLTQSAVTVALILAGAATRDGFVMMIEYTAPVFWFFLFLVGVSLFVLRYKYPDIIRQFSVPGYPILPVVFCLVCLYMLYASIAYTGHGSFAGIAVLLTGIPFIVLQKRLDKKRATE